MTLGGKGLDMALVMVTMINKKLVLYLLVTIRDHRLTLGTMSTLDRRQSKTLIVSTNVDQKPFETEISITIYSGDKWQSKTLFLAFLPMFVNC